MTSSKPTTHQRWNHTFICTRSTSTERSKSTIRDKRNVRLSDNTVEESIGSPPITRRSFVRISIRLEGNRNYAWRLFIKLIAPSFFSLFSFSIPTGRNVIAVVRVKSSDPSRPLPSVAVRTRSNCASMHRFNESRIMQAAFFRDTRWFAASVHLDEGSRNSVLSFGILLPRDGGKGAASFLFFSSSFPFYSAVRFFICGQDWVGRNGKRLERFRGGFKIISKLAAVCYI